MRGGDSLYISSVLAIRPATGEIVWHYQFSPGDPYDYDGVNELVLADLPVQGSSGKVLMQANRNGFFYVLDRTNGKFLSGTQFARKVNWATGIDPKTGRPIETPQTVPQVKKDMAGGTRGRGLAQRLRRQELDADELRPAGAQAGVHEHGRPGHEGQVRRAEEARRPELVARAWSWPAS